MCVYLTFQTIARFAIFLFYLVLEKRYKVPTNQPNTKYNHLYQTTYLPLFQSIFPNTINQPTNQPLFCLLKFSRLFVVRVSVVA